MYRKSARFTEPVLHRLLQSCCKPILLYNITGANSSKSAVNKFQYHWNCGLRKLHNVNGVNPNVVCAYLGFPPIHLDMLLCNFRFLQPFPGIIIPYCILFTIILVKRILLSAVMGIDRPTSYAGIVSVSRSTQ